MLDRTLKENFKRLHKVSVVSPVSGAQVRTLLEDVITLNLVKLGLSTEGQDLVLGSS